MNTEPWTEHAACVGAPPDLFYPDRTNHRARTLAITRFCHHCDVAADCHDYAVRTKQRYGVWGGRDFHWRYTEQAAA